MTATKTTARQVIEKRIAELEATPPMMVGSDSGTHGKPQIQHIYETIHGERYGVASFAGSNFTRCTEESVHEDTEGYVRHFPNATAKIRELARELKALKSKLVDMSRADRKARR